MRDELNSPQESSGGNPGTQGDFLDECWERACPRTSGTTGNAGSRAGHTPPQPSDGACVPARSQNDRERKQHDKAAASSPRSRVPGAPQPTTTADDSIQGDWAADARKVIAALPDESVRGLLIDYYEETAATLEYEQGHSRVKAEQLAFGLLQFQILRRGIDAMAVPR